MQEKVFNSFDFSIAGTHGAYTSLNLRHNLCLLKLLNFSCSLLIILHLLGHVLKIVIFVLI